MIGKNQEDLPLGWIASKTARGELVYENLITGKRQHEKPHVFNATVKKEVMERSKWPENLPDRIKSKLISLEEDLSRRSKFAEKYFFNLVHVLLRKYQGGINASRISALNLARDSIVATEKRGGKYASLKFSTSPRPKDVFHDSKPFKPLYRFVSWCAFGKSS